MWNKKMYELKDGTDYNNYTVSVHDIYRDSEGLNHNITSADYSGIFNTKYAVELYIKSFLEYMEHEFSFDNTCPLHGTIEIFDAGKVRGCSKSNKYRINYVLKFPHMEGYQYSCVVIHRKKVGGGIAGKYGRQN